MQSNKFLKITGILMIIGASVGIILGIFGLIGTMALATVSPVLGLLVISMVLYLIGVVVQFIAGILGVKNAAAPEKANICIVFGILVIIIQIISTILTLVAGGEFSPLSIIIGFVLPVLYLIGAFQNKKLAK